MADRKSQKRVFRFTIPLTLDERERIRKAAALQGVPDAIMARNILLGNIQKPRARNTGG